MKKLVALGIAMVAMGGVFLVNGTASAVDDAAYQMQISPIKNAIEELKPGEEYQGKFEVRNTGVKPISFTTKSAPYSVTNEKYEPSFTEKNAYTELADWMTVTPSEGEVAPGESATIEYVINVPSDTHGGQQNGAVIVQATNLDDTNGSAVQALNQIAYIIYANVEGEVNEAGKVLENNVPGFLLGSPMTVSSLVENTGNVYTDVTYKLQVYSLFGGEEVYTNEEDPVSNVVFAGTKRYSEMTWEGAPQLGIFKVKQTVEFVGEDSVNERLVFLCPIWFLVIVLLVILTAVFWLVGRIRSRRQ